MDVAGGRLRAGTAEVPLIASPNLGGPLAPRFLVMHYTAGTTLAGAVSWLGNPAARASAHLVIGRDGGIVQLVSFDRCAWHAGRSAWNGVVGLNGCSIGIELVNAGRLSRLDDGRWVSTFGQTIAADDVLVATHRHAAAPAGWQRFPRTQLDAAVEAAAAVCAAYAIEGIVGHDDIAPLRKIDPGPAFPMAEFRLRVQSSAVVAAA